MKRTFASPFVVGLVLTVVMSLGLSTMGAAQAVTPASKAGTAVAKTVAKNPQGSLSTRIVGTTSNGRRVTGSFVPLKFVKVKGNLRVRGLLSGVVHRANGTTDTFSVVRTMGVKTVNGTPARAGRLDARASCSILRLVLRPLDLDLLGLQVHLDKVLLTVIAKSGAGALLGNLLCAVTGLLDGGIGGALGRVTNLLNRVLAVLRLGS